MPVPGITSANLTQPQGEEKDCEARPPPPPTPSEEAVGRGAIFSISSALDAPGSGITVRKIHLDVSSLVSRTLLHKLPPVSVGRPGVINCLLPSPLPTLGKDLGVKTHGDKSRCSVGASMCHPEAPKLNP